VSLRERSGAAPGVATVGWVQQRNLALGFLNRTGDGGLYTSRACVRSS
jgi:hypothetical protein